MNAKLTLSLDRDIIEQAKEFARSQHKSLSKLIEGYLRQTTARTDSATQVTPLVARLSGVIDARKLGDGTSDYAENSIHKKPTRIVRWASLFIQYLITF